VVIIGYLRLLQRQPDIGLKWIYHSADGSEYSVLRARLSYMSDPLFRQRTSKQDRNCNFECSVSDTNSDANSDADSDANTNSFTFAVAFTVTVAVTVAVAWANSFRPSLLRRGQRLSLS